VPVIEPVLEPSATPDDAARCQARPLVVLRGFRTDLLCASLTSGAVAFLGGEVPVCRIHEKMYLRWGAGAEASAREAWGWPILRSEITAVD
jgi:hypothetical protein